MGHPALIIIRRKVCCGFLSPLKSIALAGFEPPTFVSSGKHANHHTTKAASYLLNSIIYFPLSSALYGLTIN
jgi:hypothetical protein